MFQIKIPNTHIKGRAIDAKGIVNRSYIVKISIYQNVSNSICECKSTSKLNHNIESPAYIACMFLPYCVCGVQCSGYIKKSSEYGGIANNMKGAKRKIIIKMK